MRAILIKLGYLSAIAAAVVPLAAITVSAVGGLDVRYLHQASEVQLNLAKLDYSPGQDPAGLYGVPTNTYARVVFYDNERVVTSDEAEGLNYYLIKDEKYPVQVQSMNAVVKYLVGGLLVGAGALIALASFVAPRPSQKPEAVAA